jgi:hypothetical protein
MSSQQLLQTDYVPFLLFQLMQISHCEKPILLNIWFGQLGQSVYINV